jgi:prepilin signal peptidase PulO-like enzyme (type II secretory pathway)
MEGLEPGSKQWQAYGPLILSALLFAIFAFHVGPSLALFVRSVFILVLVQVIFFDLEHRLILDKVMFPSMILALGLSLFRQPWWAGIATGLGAGLLFLALAVIGWAIFKAEALGLGDVKLALFMGLLLGPLPTVQAVFYGVFMAGLVSVVFIVWHRSFKGTIAYGPYLAAGTLIVLFLQPVVAGQ